MTVVVGVVMGVFVFVFVCVCLFVLCMSHKTAVFPVVNGRNFSKR